MSFKKSLYLVAVSTVLIAMTDVVRADDIPMNTLNTPAEYNGGIFRYGLNTLEPEKKIEVLFKLMPIYSQKLKASIKMMENLLDLIF